MATAVPITPALRLPHLSTRLPGILLNFALLGGGALLWVLALKWFMIPHNILSGGLLGIAMICCHFFNAIDVAWLNLLLNLPLFWLGWRYLGKAFTLYSIYGSLLFSVMADEVTLP